MICNHCQQVERVFDKQRAQNDLFRYHQKGPDEPTQDLVNALVKMGVQGQTLLDIGSGIGVIQYELLSKGLIRAIAVEASTAFLELANEEARRAGYEGKITYLKGDYTEVHRDAGYADIVTLDKVVCCYPDAVKLVSLSSTHATRL